MLLNYLFKKYRLDYQPQQKIYIMKFYPKINRNLTKSLIEYG
jgi:hypothetical protein